METIPSLEVAPEPLRMFDMSVSQKPEEESRTRPEVVVKDKTCLQSSCLKRVKGQTSAAAVVSAVSAASAATEMIRTYEQTQC